MSKAIGFIGAGKMAEALCRGFLSAGLVKPSEVIVSDINPNKLKAAESLGVAISKDNRKIVTESEVIVLAVKPPTVKEILRQMAPVFSRYNLLISVAAGVTTSSMEEELPAKSRVIRVMPNTPAVVQAGASVFSLGTNVLDTDRARVRKMLSCVGLCEEMPEFLMDAVTGLSGNGPAYGLVTIQSLADGGVKMGLSKDQAIRLAAQCMLGAAKMVLETGKHPEMLKDEICSPGGTSVHALHKLEQAGYRGALIDAVEAGTLRSKDIGRTENGSDVLSLHLYHVLQAVKNMNGSGN